MKFNAERTVFLLDWSEVKRKVSYLWKRLAEYRLVVLICTLASLHVLVDEQVDIV